jgi:hypothetical protein
MEEMKRLKEMKRLIDLINETSVKQRALALEHEKRSRDEVGRIYTKLVKQIKRTKASPARFRCTLNYASENDVITVCKERLSNEHGIFCKHVSILDDSDVDVEACLTSSVMCCCIPLLCWVPYMILKPNTHVHVEYEVPSYTQQQDLHPS